MNWHEFWLLVMAASFIASIFESRATPIAFFALLGWLGTSAAAELLRMSAF